MLQQARKALCLLALYSSCIFAQNLISGVPSCASDCVQITNSNSYCSTNIDPPQCICQINNLILTDPTAACPGCVSVQDQNQLKNWYNNKCPQDSGTTTKTSSSSKPAPTPAPTSNGGAGTTSSGAPPSSETGSNTASKHNSKNQSWWDLHAKWIAMVIVLIIAFAIIIAVGIYLKRRHDFKHNRAPRLPSNAVWGPNTSQFQAGQVSNQGYTANQIDDDPPMRERYHAR